MPEEVLRSAEDSASKNITSNVGSFVSNVAGKKNPLKSTGRMKKFGAAGFILVSLVIIMLFFGAGNLIPAAISNRLLEETDVGRGDAVESTAIVFQQAMREGDIPDNTTENLASYGVTVGYLDDDGNFQTGNQCEKDGGDGTECVLKMNGEIITAGNFINKFNNNTELYNAIINSTYSNVSDWYDESAEEVFEEIGTNRNNFTRDTEFKEVMIDKMSQGSDISIASAKGTENDASGSSYGNSGGDTQEFMNSVRDQNTADDEYVATMNSADTLKAADIVAKEQRSSLFYLLIMENVSKMQYGEGTESKINEAMNYLYEERTTTVVDVETGEEIEVKGSAFDSPSLYAVLSGNNIDTHVVSNYSNDRILKTVENQYDGANIDGNIIDNTVASIKPGVKGDMGRYLTSSDASANMDKLGKVSPTVSSSLSNNAFETIGGVEAGEMLVEGAVNVGAKLARASGGTPGDETAVNEYMALNAKVLAMDAAADRLNRSPFDITSKNTFLGSIMYNFAINLQLSSSGNPLLSSVMGFMRTTSNAFAALFPGANADDTDGYLTSHGDCETVGRMKGAVGSPQCVGVVAFDTSTLDDPLNNAGYKDFVDANTTNNGTSVKSDSELAKFIKYNSKSTPFGVTDGDIIEEEVKLGGFLETVLSWFSDDVSAFIRKIFIKIYCDVFGHPEPDMYATGAMFVNSSENSENWQKYKWAQRYMSVTRAADNLKRYAVNYDGRMAYNFGQFAWEESPVLAYKHKYKEEKANEIAEEEKKEEEIKLSDEDKQLLISYLGDYPEILDAVKKELNID